MPIKGPNNRMRTRIMVLIMGFVFVGFSAVAVRLFYMQVINYDFYQEMALEFQTRDTIVTPTRGTIYDRNMKELALSASTETIYVNTNRVVNEKKVEGGVAAEIQQENLARMLSEKLELSYESVLKKVQSSGYQTIKKNVEKDIADEIREEIQQSKYTGIEMTPDTKRYYPYGSYASHLIGFLNYDGEGSNGIELQYEEELKGTAGRIIRTANAVDIDMSFEYAQYIPAEDGNSIVLTIDESIQHFLEKNLDTALADNTEARGGVAGLVMDVKTGEILAMAGKPDFDLNAPYEISSEMVLANLESDIQSALESKGVTASIGEEFLRTADEAGLAQIADNSEAAAEVRQVRLNSLYGMWKNKTITTPYEPGSTFKLMNLATAYEVGVVNENTMFYCTGHKRVEGWDKAINCWKRAGHGHENLTEALMNSCNPAMIEMALKVGTDRFYEYFRAFGLLDKTGIDLPGEANSYMHEEDKFTTVSLATSSFGQSFTITPIQLVSMVGAIVDDGNLKTPHVVKEILNADGSVKQTMGTEVVRQVISADTSAFMRQAMEQVVAAGTGQNAYVAGYRVGGKTATAELLPRGSERYSASFVGVAPMDDPQIVVYVVLDDLPAYVPHGGGAIAAPVVARIMNDVLPYLGVEPVYDESEGDRREITMPNVVGMTREEAQAQMNEYGISFRFSGDGDTVTDQVPSSGVKVPASANMIIYMGGTKSGDLIAVPSVTGLTPRQAQERLEAAGLYMKRTGIATKNTTGLTSAAKQSPAQGTQVGIGTVVTVEFSNSTNIGD